MSCCIHIIHFCQLLINIFIVQDAHLINKFKMQLNQPPKLKQIYYYEFYISGALISPLLHDTHTKV